MLELPAGEGFVVLLSGGLDSSVLTYALARSKRAVKALTVLYGQRHAKELESATVIAHGLGVEHRIVDLTGIRSILGASALLNGGTAIPEGHYEDESMRVTVVPNRNMLLLSIAAAWSVASGLDGVAYAAHAGDHAIYPDCRPAFAEAMEAALSLCDYRPQTLARPFVGLTKGDIVQLGSKLGVPFENTWSCYKGGARHCGRCGTCTERIEAFKRAGVPDPTVYE